MWGVRLSRISRMRWAKRSRKACVTIVTGLFISQNSELPLLYDSRVHATATRTWWCTWSNLSLALGELHLVVAGRTSDLLPGVTVLDQFRRENG